MINQFREHVISLMVLKDDDFVYDVTEDEKWGNDLHGSIQSTEAEPIDLAKE